MGCWDIQALLCARICHDLSGVVGATAAGMELLKDSLDLSESDDNAEVVNFVASAADGAVARVRFLRLALGPAAPSHPVDNLHQMTESYLATLGDGSVTLGWAAGSDTLHGAWAKILANIVIVAGDSLTTGGRMDIDLSGPALTITVCADRIHLSPAILAFLTGQSTDDTPPQTPKEAQALLLHALLAAAGTMLEIGVSEDDRCLTFSAYWCDKDS